MKIDNIGKIFMIGDLHMGIRNASVIWKDDMLHFFDKFIESLPRHGFNENTDILMLTGDVFHSREFLNIMIVHNVMDVLKKLTSKFKRGVYVILGNHDVYYKRNNSIHSLEFAAEQFANFHVFAQPDTLIINGTHNFLMLPWNDEIPELDKAIAEHDECQYMFCHLEVEGFKYNKTMRVDNGVAIDSIRKFKRVYAGHLHHKQENGNVLYVGTPWQQDFGDMETSRGYYVISVAEDMLHEEYFGNEWSPRFVECMFDDIMNMTFEDAGKILDHNYVHVNIPISAARNFSFNTFMDMIGDRKISPRRIEFKQYDDSYSVDETQFTSTADFNMVKAAQTILEEKKYTHAEIENVLGYFGQLFMLAKNTEKDIAK